MEQISLLHRPSYSTVIHGIKQASGNLSNGPFKMACVGNDVSRSLFAVRFGKAQCAEEPSFAGCCAGDIGDLGRIGVDESGEILLQVPMGR